MKSFFPDVNVWLALAYSGHQHHAPASSWFAGLDVEAAYFCRITQLSFLRLLTHPSVMREDLKTLTEAWRAYDTLLSDERVFFHLEPDHQQLESVLRRRTPGKLPLNKQWPDAYLAAFAEVAGLILVTFDHGLHRSSAGSLLLG